MTKQRYSVHIGVYLLLTRQISGHTELLLQKRANTGYMDGQFDASCSGHLEPGESLTKCIIREAQEELGITIDEQYLEQVFIGQIPGEDYLKIFFSTDLSHVQGTPHINEPKFCSDLRWFPIDHLPTDTALFTKNTLACIQQGIRYSLL